MTGRVLTVVFLLTLAASAQTQITITDSQGNRTTGQLSNGQVSFRDSNGNTSSGTIRDGYVHMNTSQGDVIFGTVNNGQVFLTDNKGNTTGTIRDGYINLNNSDGSTTTGTYSRNSDGSVTSRTTTTGGIDPVEEERKRQEQQQRDAQDRAYWEQQQKQNYEAGQQAGRAVGNLIVAAAARHRINEFCKANPTSSYLTSDGISIDCPSKPLDSWEQGEADKYCYDHPGSWIGFGKHRVDCVTPPDPPTLQWAKWEMEGWARDFHHHRKDMTPDRMEALWERWRETYCQLAGSTATYKTLEGKKQTCSAH